MKFIKPLYFFIIASLISLALIPELSKHPLSGFVLKINGDTLEAFKMHLPLGFPNSSFETVSLQSEQEREGKEIFKSNDLGRLTNLAKKFGEFSFAIGLSSHEDGWSPFLGNTKAFLKADGGEMFGNLQWLDILYLSLFVNAPKTSFTPLEIQLENGNTSTPPSNPVSQIFSQPSPQITPGIVRVEILNGCGITNAADWAAMRFKGAGITITDTGNAENFKYSKTVVRSSTGMPVALEDALDRIGLSKDMVEDVTDLPPSIDVVVVIGKDFVKLKERVRERIHH